MKLISKEQWRKAKEYNDTEFEEEVDKAYKIIWDMYSPRNWDIEKEQKLLNILNTIDNELGR